MSDSEQIIGKLSNQEVYFTDRRFIFINAPNAQYAAVGGGGLLGGLISEVAFHYSKKKVEQKQEENKDLTLNEKLQKLKGSYAVAYADMNEFVVSKSFSGGQICIKTKSGWKYLNLTNKETFKQISALLPTIPVLNGKFTINH